MILFLLPFLFFLFSAYGDDQLRIVQPESLVNQFSNTNGLVPERPALFGVPPFGRTITGLLIWATPGDLDGCQPINKTKNPKWPTTPAPLILMVDRGDCTFVTKVRNAQTAGAQAVVVVDNVDEPTLPYMADDGSGGDIFIPSVLIFKSDGQKIKDADASPNVTVVVSMTWDIPSPDDRVEWTMWTSSNDAPSVVFKSVFGTAVRALNQSAQFTPHYLILNGASSGCTAPNQPCGTQCTNQGRYCATDPEQDTSRGLDGSDIVVENLRQICIFQEINKTGVPEKWWDYVSQFQTQCGGSKETWTQTCSYNILTLLSISSTNVDACVVASGGTTTGNNSLLEAEMAAVVQDGVFYLPTIIINMAAYRGSLACPTPISYTSCGVLGAICSGYPPDNLPCACTSSIGCDLCVNRDECGQCGGTGKVDVCGLCLPADNPQYNKSCAGCDGIPYSNVHTDACGICGGTGSLDKCGRCLQANDPQRVDNGGIDACGLCLSYTDPRYNQTCVGCDGTPMSGKKNDPCGVCGGTGSLDKCARCLQADDPLRVDNGGFDACGVCLSYTDTRYNKSCAGCDGVPLSGTKYDACGECGGTKTQDQCGTGLSVGAIIAIALSSFAVVGFGVYCFLKRQQAKMRDDIDALLAQYQPLEGAATRPQHNQPPPVQQSHTSQPSDIDTDAQALISPEPVSDL